MSKPIVGLILTCVCCMVSAQAPKSVAAATYVTPDDMADALKGPPNQAAPLIDRPARVIKAGEQYLGVAMVQRTVGDQGALAHSKIDEIYYILEGGGTLLTGGTLVNARETASSLTVGPGWSGTGIQGGESRRVTPGDVVFIPAGTPHMFSQLDRTIRYLTYRVDPTRVLGLK
jgi:mannose-6-phosphate isomerase-like protein (cupin superfamily)